jgi:hypothetical protein
MLRHGELVNKIQKNRMTIETNMDNPAKITAVGKKHLNYDSWIKN